MITLETEEALAYTEALAIQGVNNPTVLIWQAPQTTAALGISQEAARELNLDTLIQDNIPIVRRQSGGGAVILNPDVLCFEVIAPLGAATADLSIRESFQAYTMPLRSILQYRELDTASSGISDITITVDGIPRKIAGCAQLRKKKAMVIHASVLVNLDKNLLEKYLSFPSDVPDYRQNRTHTDFCLNLSEVIPGLTPQQLSNELESKFSANGWNIITQKSQISSELAEELLNKKYTQNSWNIERKRPKITG